MYFGRLALRFRVGLLLGLVIAVSGCASRSKARDGAPKWEFGFWFWDGSSARVKAGPDPVALLYFQAGSISAYPFIRDGERWRVHGHWRDDLPPARAYWAVFRFDEHGIPDLKTVPMLVNTVARLREEARSNGQQLAGIQLDIDSPTRALPGYAAYVRALRKALPQDVPVSITALLDWFRSGSSVGEVLQAVDEFVPQFYDLRNPGSVGGRPVIAAPVDGAKWGPVFNRFGRRYRIGISTFGRSRLVPAVTNAGQGGGYVAYGDLRPLEVAMNPAFRLDTSVTEAKEIVLRYRADRDVRIGYTEMEAGSAFEFVLSTPEAIRASVDEARRMGEYCAGVLFFRWPSFNESMAALPEEVLAAAGAAPAVAKPTVLQSVDEECALVHCTDLYLTDTPALVAKPIRYRIRSSTALEYFLPDEKTPVRMTGPDLLEFTLPPYCGRTQLHLGRAVAARPARYSLEENR